MGTDKNHDEKTVEMWSILTKMVAELSELFHGKYSSEDAIRAFLEKILKFYDADLVATLDADLAIGRWSASYHIDRVKGWMQGTLFYPLEDVLRFQNWVDALGKKDTIIYLTEKDIMDEFGDAYEDYKRLQVKTVIGIPFVNQLQGFLVIKNPKRFAEYKEIAQMIGYGIANEIFNYRLFNNLMTKEHPREISGPYDIKFDFLGKFGIHSFFTDISETDMGSMEIRKILAAIALKPSHMMSYTEIDKLLHPDGYYTGNYDYITQLIYRFQRTYKTYFPDNALFSCDRNSQKYYFRDELNIKSDLDELQRLFDLALSESDPNRKLVIMRRFVWLYGDGILPEYDEWPLLKEVRHKYETLYYRILRMMVPNIRSEMANSTDQKFLDDIL